GEEKRKTGRQAGAALGNEKRVGGLLPEASETKGV
ncbi:hypothetical protein ALC53_01942, partial [Atta colombica]